MNVGSVGREFAAIVGLAAPALQRVTPPRGGLPWAPRLPVGALATDSVALASLALNLVAADRFGGEPAAVQVDERRIAASFGSERVLRVDGDAPSVWAPLSGFWPVADGWVRTHANYTHHERALRAVLGLGDGGDAAVVADVLRDWPAVELEERAAAAGAVVGAVRTPHEWRQHPQGRAVGASPLVERRRLGEAAPRRWRQGDAPLTGVRVLDLTRVIAGPIAARDLALAGAEVLRVDSPRLAETGWIHLDTGQGKRSTLPDLGDRGDREAFDALLGGADVLLTGYRPGSLSRYGLEPEALAQRHPGLVTASVSAWGWAGDWAPRRGFDSIVQAVSGIAVLEGADAATPGALPVQALDHSTGHFLAAAIALALAEQRREGGSIDVRMSLARTAHALLASSDPVGEPADRSALPALERRLSAVASLTYAPPVLAFVGAPDDYAEVGGRWGADPAEWRG